MTWEANVCVCRDRVLGVAGWVTGRVGVELASVSWHLGTRGFLINQATGLLGSRGQGFLGGEVQVGWDQGAACHPCPQIRRINDVDNLPHSSLISEKTLLVPTETGYPGFVLCGSVLARFGCFDNIGSVKLGVLCIYIFKSVSLKNIPFPPLGIYRILLY